MFLIRTSNRLRAIFVKKTQQFETLSDAGQFLAEMLGLFKHLKHPLVYGLVNDSAE